MLSLLKRPGGMREAHQMKKIVAFLDFRIVYLFNPSGMIWGSGTLLMDSERNFAPSHGLETLGRFFYQPPYFPWKSEPQTRKEKNSWPKNRTQGVQVSGGKNEKTKKGVGKTGLPPAICPDGRQAESREGFRSEG